MVVKVYISGISGNKEVKKRQQRVLMILDSKCVKYDVIDITEPGKEGDKDFMQNNAKSNGGTVSDPNPRSPLPPQVFNDDEYCGDYDQFDLANEVDTLEQFLKVEVPPEEPPQAEPEKEKVVNGDAGKDDESKENPPEKDSADGDVAPETKEEGAAKGKTPSREATPADRVSSKETSPTKDADLETVSKEEPEKEPSSERQKSVEKDITLKEKSPSPSKEKSPSPTKDKSPSPTKEKSPSPTKESSSPTKEKSPSPTKESSSPTKEKSPSPTKDDKAENKDSKEPTPVKYDEAATLESKEATPEIDNSVNENGTTSSREQSEEKVVIESKKDNPSESLISSEQMAASE